ncbi:MAG: hypothetical protein CMM60_06860 [Rhodospirillaceae bacterium]|nr:hypothetical protein [Rhodospirillaceae bacterium]|tara:strand:+ start:4282 stop:4467 length:186 start_codon:yes stop_codon:yes gene_type:complete
MPRDFEIRNQHFLKEMEQATRPRGRYLGQAFRIAEADAGDAPGGGSVFTIAFPRQRMQTGY